MSQDQLVWGPEGLNRLKGKFSDATKLPEIPTSAIDLCKAIDDGDCSTAQLERLVLADPSITAGVLRAANSALYGGATRMASTIKGAIMTLGERSVRAIAVSVWIQSMVHAANTGKSFNPRAFAEHSMFVGFLSKFLLSRLTRSGNGSSKFTVDELYAGGVLHDLSFGLLAVAEPAIYDDLHELARERLLTHDDAFLERFGEPVSVISECVCDAWNLPEPIRSVLLGFASPHKAETEVDALACVHYADFLAVRAGKSMCPWRVEVWVSPTIVDMFSMSDEDLEAVLELTERHVVESAIAA